MVESKKPIVVITGVSGYLGSHVALTFLKDGSYNVRGTVRDTKNPVKIEPLRKAFGDYFDQLTLIEANLNDRESIFAAINGSNFVIHTASPAPLAPPNNEDELILPAVNGTKAVMEACHANKIKRVVITSSVAAVIECKPINRPADGKFSEQNWSDPDGDHIDAYSKSKVLAERSAWDFNNSLPEEERIEIVTINPGLILGPPFVGAGFNSGDLITNILEGKYPGVPKIKLPIVGVTEVAEAHLQALKRPEAANKRFVLVNDTIWFQDFVQILYDEFQPQGYNFSRTEFYKFVVQIGSWFKPELKHAVRMWGLELSFDNSQSKDVLGVQYGVMSKTIVDMTYAMFASGALVDRRTQKK